MSFLDFIFPQYMGFRNIDIVTEYFPWHIDTNFRFPFLNASKVNTVFIRYLYSLWPIFEYF